MLDTGSGMLDEPVPALFCLLHPAVNGTTSATSQFEIADGRTPHEVADLIRKLGYEPVWKDWDGALVGSK